MNKYWNAENPCVDVSALARNLVAAGFPPRRIMIWLHGPCRYIPGPYLAVEVAYRPVDPAKRVRVETIGRRLGMIVDGGGSSMQRKGKRVVHVKSDTVWLLMAASTRRKREAAVCVKKSARRADPGAP